MRGAPLPSLHVLDIGKGVRQRFRADGQLQRALCCIPVLIECLDFDIVGAGRDKYRHIEIVEEGKE